MMREIIEIDEDLCVGCGNCVPNCHQGALQIIDGKARLISDLMCEGIGACVGHCPTGAMTIEKREAEPYDEEKVMDKITAGGPRVIRAHLEHLRQHNQKEYLEQAEAYLEKRGIPNPLANQPQELHGHGGGCPGSAARMLRRAPGNEHPGPVAPAGQSAPAQSGELRQWPVQLHLLNPAAPYLQGADLLVAADCTAYAAGNFHRDFLKGKALAIACPKLDQGQQIYLEKLVRMIDESRINTLTVLIMEVPCCSGLLALARTAAGQAERRVPVKAIILSLEGEIQSEEWI
ncbi:4Fe-4S binding domain-containing protein [Alkalispirochaeta americana]|uniref:4Fe-4S binding domain-containing protein n=1 Tax=Alkalispirochaeta americana TaxID=159291 RepID=A0A1N6UTG8_9SPIO|nr:4Fe-4S binding protein [Alkalispirochaeta americana]SIQ68879.1 4Fe-4S binding domain-containing protein [Alkalispirochaeta americana]